jgi:carboxypeptidase family protein
MARWLSVTTIAFGVGALGQMALARQQPPGAPTPAAGVVSGRVVTADGQPVRKAQVRLGNAPARWNRTTASDGDGLFTFTDVPAGEYALSGSKAGHLDSVYGARRPGLTARGTTIRVAAGARISDIVFTLPRGGVITGVVTDEFGDPAFNVPVRAVRFYYENGGKRLAIAGNAATDDRGVYRVAGLQPGEYLVSAVPRDIVSAVTSQAEALRDRQAQWLAEAKAKGGELPNFGTTSPPPTVGYVPIFYPGTPSGAVAASVRVSGTEEVPGIDIRLQNIETVSISGKISSAEGLPQTRIQLLDMSMPMNNIGVWFRDMRADGTFAFHGLVPGPYTVKAFGTPGGRAGDAGGEMWGAAEVLAQPRVGATNIELRMQRGVTISGTLSLAGLPASVQTTAIRLSLEPIPSAGDWEMSTIELRPDATGAFTARNALPGQYYFAVRGLPAGWAVDTAMFEGRDAADHQLKIDGSRNLAGIEVTLTARHASLTGTISTTAGPPVSNGSVIVFPADRRFWLPRSRRIHVALTDGTGRYSLQGLPAGDYRLAPLLDFEPGREFDPEFLASLMNASIAVPLGAGEARTLDVRAIIR